MRTKLGSGLYLKEEGRRANVQNDPLYAVLQPVEESRIHLHYLECIDGFKDKNRRFNR